MPGRIPLKACRSSAPDGTCLEAARWRRKVARRHCRGQSDGTSGRAVSASLRPYVLRGGLGGTQPLTWPPFQPPGQAPFQVGTLRPRPGADQLPIALGQLELEHEVAERLAAFPGSPSQMQTQTKNKTKRVFNRKQKELEEHPLWQDMAFGSAFSLALLSSVPSTPTSPPGTALPSAAQETALP